MKICKKCGVEIPNAIKINGKRKTLTARKYCLTCSPFNSRNTRKLCGEYDKRNAHETFSEHPSKKEIFDLVFERGYRISDDGLVFSKTGKQLKLRLNSKYLKFSFHISVNKKKIVKSIPVHRLQAYKKFGEIIFMDGIQVRHLDNNKLNNSWDNLSVGNNSDNQLDIPKELRSATLKNLGADKIKHIIELYSTGTFGYQKLAKQYDVSFCTIRNIVKNNLKWTQELACNTPNP